MTQKSKYHTLITLIIIFIVGVVGVGFQVYVHLPHQLLKTLSLSSSALGNIQSTILFSLVLIMLVLLLGMGLVSWLFIEWQKKTESHIVTIDNFKENQKLKQEPEPETVHLYQNTEKLAAIHQQITSSSNPYQEALNVICNKLEASVGVFFESIYQDDSRYLQSVATYAYHLPDSHKIQFEFGEGVAGQVAKEGEVVQVSTIPQGYIQVLSGLGEASPSHLLCVPFQNDEKQVVCLVEIAGFNAFLPQDIELVKHIGKFVSELLEKH